MSTFYAERRKDQQLAREQDRVDRREEHEARRQEEAEREERARRTRREALKEKKQRRLEAKAARAEKLRKLGEDGDTIAALIVMSCSITPAFYFQLQALTAVPGLPSVIALCLATMLEAGAWVATVAGDRAKKAGRPIGVFRAAMWGCAGVAAVINYSHAPASAGNWLAWVLAAASLGGVGFWELRGMGRHGGRAGRTRQERRRERERVRHTRRRRARFGTVWERHLDILAAYPHGALDVEAAWVRAWRDVHGADVAETAVVMAVRLAADSELETVLADAGRTPERLAVDRFLDDLFGDGGPAGSGSAGGPENGPRGSGGTGTATLPRDPSEGPTALGGKGKQRSGRPSPTASEKPLAEADVERVRKLADALGGAHKLSARNVREAVGCRTEYAVRLRDAVKNERRG
ncbi:hypothetical protein [Streptomyces jumonjinensis]|uniref:hypothetical protein n=1 Tax=Streptomyces jumonjinensis TaxID=1945 RepID=UPI00379B023E